MARSAIVWAAVAVALGCGSGCKDGGGERDASVEQADGAPIVRRDARRDAPALDGAGDAALVDGSLRVDAAPDATVSADAGPPCGAGSRLFTIKSTSKACGCFVGKACPGCGSLGDFAAGTYRFVYYGGAIQTATGDTWNRRHLRGCRLCDTVARCWSPRVTIGTLPGFSDIGWPTAALALAANRGKFVDLKITKTTKVLAWYQDNECTDNVGSVVYCVRKLP